MWSFQQKLDLISVLPSSNFSAVKCTNVNCSNGYLLPKNSLDYNSVWTCKSLEPKVTDGCDIEMSSEDINKVVDEIEEVSMYTKNVNTCLYYIHTLELSVYMRISNLQNVEKDDKNKHFWENCYWFNFYHF